MWLSVPSKRLTETFYYLLDKWIAAKNIHHKGRKGSYFSLCPSVIFRTIPEDDKKYHDVRENY